MLMKPIQLLLPLLGTLVLADLASAQTPPPFSCPTASVSNPSEYTFAWFTHTKAGHIVGEVVQGSPPTSVKGWQPVRVPPQGPYDGQTDPPPNLYLQTTNWDPQSNTLTCTYSYTNYGGGNVSTWIRVEGE